MSNDLIKREDAIKALRLEYPMMPMFKGLREEWAVKTEGYRKAEEVIMNLPSADRPQGEWEERPSEDWISIRRWYCSECGEWQTYGMTNYCPNCGADMRGDNDGEDIQSADE